MIKGLGIDIIEVERIKRIIKKWQGNFLNKIFTQKEINYCEKSKNYDQHFAARFAAKEAVVKMLGTGFQNISWKEIEIINNKKGKPQVNLYKKAKKHADNSGINIIHISLSHQKEYAIAEVIGEGE